MSFQTTFCLQKRNYNFYFGENEAPTPPPVLTGLIFPGNASDGGNIRLLWTGANMISRLSCTVLFRANFVNQNDYYSVGWFSQNTGSWDGGMYNTGINPYPTDGSFNPCTGNSSFVGGDTHYFEIAGLGGGDYIASDGGPGCVPQATLQVTKGVWVRQGFSIETAGATVIHTHKPDFENNPGFQILQNFPLGSIPTPADPAFYIGSSDWRANQPSPGRNDECTSAIIRAIVHFSAPIGAAHQSNILALDTDSEVIAYCAANGLSSDLWYCNMNPTPDDVSDKSGNGHDPSWVGNGTIPTLWTSE